MLQFIIQLGSIHWFAMLFITYVWIIFLTSFLSRWVPVTNRLQCAQVAYAISNKFFNSKTHFKSFSVSPWRSACNLMQFPILFYYKLSLSVYGNAFGWITQALTDEKSTLVQVRAWCHQATSHYQHQCWPSTVLPYGITSPQWVQILGMLSSALLQNKSTPKPNPGYMSTDLYVCQFASFNKCDMDGIPKY